MSTEPESFEYDGGVVEPGQSVNLRYPVTESYLGEPVRMPVTIINGEQPGLTAFLSAAIHGDELNGIEVVREVAHEWDHSTLHGTVVCLPVLNPQGFMTQQRYLPIYDTDLNRSFPGNDHGTNASRVAWTIWSNFIEPCDIGLDFHTSTRGRTNMFQVRADMSNPAVARLANAYGTNLIISGKGSSGMLRRTASEAGVPTITLEMGEAHRFERDLIDHALDGVRSVFAEYGLLRRETVHWPGWRTVITDEDEKRWLRADVGGIVEMAHERGNLVHADELICTITNPFKTEVTEVRAPFTGLLVGVLANPVVYPGNPLCHFVALDEKTERIVELNRGTTHQ